MNTVWLLLALHLTVATFSIIHALLYKKDPRSALGWIAACFAYPLIGPLLYFLFGINRVKTKAQQMEGRATQRWFSYERAELESEPNLPFSQLPAELDNSAMHSLALSSTAITRHPLLEGNTITPFFTGDEAYQEMLNAIDTAQQSICLTSYIFDSHGIGRQFIDALKKAKQRGVGVRVMLDGVGEHYSFPRTGSRLRKCGIDFVRFIPPKLIPPSLHLNLRNHRKLLIVDNRIGFTGGMNIANRHLNQLTNGKPGIKDIHFRFEGSIVVQLQEAFEEDWTFVTKQPLRKADFFPTRSIGEANCRVVTDGPNEDMEKLITILTGACAVAQQKIAIITPYFLPPAILINALQTAALRGVDVSIILPRHSNQPLVDWASHNMLWQLLQYGVKIYYQPPPFDHSKILLIDNHYAHIGSANLDPRSLRLNFELTVEVFDQLFTEKLWAHFSSILKSSKPLTINEVDNRSFPVRIRDATAWLFSPYL